MQKLLSCFSIYSHLDRVDWNLQTAGCCNQKDLFESAHPTMLILNLEHLNIFSMHFVVLMLVTRHLHLCTIMTFSFSILLLISFLRNPWTHSGEINSTSSDKHQNRSASMSSSPACHLNRHDPHRLHDWHMTPPLLCDFLPFFPHPHSAAGVSRDYTGLINTS